MISQNLCLLILLLIIQRFNIKRIIFYIQKKISSIIFSVMLDKFFMLKAAMIFLILVCVEILGLNIL